MPALKEDEFERLREFVYKNYGINLSKKKHLVEGRLRNVIAENGFETFGEYFDVVINDTYGKYTSELVSRLTTNHTYFMREKAHFDFYRNVVLPYLRDTVRDKSLAIWSAGCSTGEEPCEIAIENDMFFGREAGFWDTRILATDISDRVLEIAKRGVYQKESIVALPDQYKIKYTIPFEQGYMFKGPIRNNIIYKKFNLMDPFIFKRKFHVVFCRNVMIYFDNETKINLVNKFYEVTEPGGYLFVGHSEYLDKAKIKYEYIEPAIYRKRVDRHG